MSMQCRKCGGEILKRKYFSRTPKNEGLCRKCINHAIATKHEQIHSITYTTWACMLKRVKDPNKPYLSKGITVCERWQDFRNFLQDMGERPSRLHSIDRKDNNGNYEPMNCRWATKQQQASNTSRNVFLIAFGETKTASEWTRDARCRVGITTFTRRMQSGWTPEAIITKPSRIRAKCETTDAE